MQDVTMILGLPLEGNAVTSIVQSDGWRDFGRLEKENIQHRARAKVDDEMPNPESRLRRERAEVWKTGHYSDPEWMLGMMSYFLLNGPKVRS